jgi:hypothetical protein
MALTKHPVMLALILLMLAGAVYAATRIFSSPTVATVSEARPETPQEIAERTAASFRKYSLEHDVELLAGLYALDSVRYLGGGLLSRDSILSELRDDYRGLARTDSFAVTIDTVEFNRMAADTAKAGAVSSQTTRAIGDSAIEVQWHTAYARMRSDSSRFSGSTRDELLLVREGSRWSIARHERRLLAGVAPDGPFPRRVAADAASPRTKSSSPARRSGGAARSTPAPRSNPIVTVRIDRGVKVDIGKPGKGHKPEKAKKRRK